jgi:hypothetical protein
MTQPNRQTIDTRRPADFHESLNPVLPTPISAPALPTVALPSNTFRYALATLWAVAAISAGAGIGALIISARSSAEILGEAPVPVATAQLSVAPDTTPATIQPATTTDPQSLAVSPSDAVKQAQAGNPFAVASASFYQPISGTNALQPGFSHYGFAQGARGTDPVR